MNVPARSSSKRKNSNKSKSLNNSTNNEFNRETTSEFISISEGSNSSNYISKNNKTTSMTTSKPKQNRRKSIRNIVRDTLFNFSLNHHRRTKRFLTSSFFPNQRSTYYRTRPINQPLVIDLPNSYRTIPLRTGYSNNYLNSRLSNAYISSPIVSPLNKPISSPIISPLNAMNAPIVNRNPSIHHSNSPSTSSYYDYTTENSNSFHTKTTTALYGSTMTTNTTKTVNSLSPETTTVDNLDDDTDVQLKQECAGSILPGNRYILSAAHCFENPDPGVYKVGVGSHLLKDLKLYSVQRIHLHPKYNRKQFYNDIAILELNQTLDFDENTQPICIPNRKLLKIFNLDEKYLGKEDSNTFEERKSLSSSNNQNKSSNRSIQLKTLIVDAGYNLGVRSEVNTIDVVVVGWGSQLYNSGNIGSERLRKAELKLVKQDDCDSKFRKLRSTLIPNGITNNMICASGGKFFRTSNFLFSFNVTDSFFYYF